MLATSETKQDKLPAYGRDSGDKWKWDQTLHNLQFRHKIHWIRDLELVRRKPYHGWWFPLSRSYKNGYANHRDQLNITQRTSSQSRKPGSGRCCPHLAPSMLQLDRMKHGDPFLTCTRPTASTRSPKTRNKKVIHHIYGHSKLKSMITMRPIWTFQTEGCIIVGGASKQF